MGLTNAIITRDILKCPKCRSGLLGFKGEPTEWESKDTYNRCQRFVQHEEMIIDEGGMEFVARGEPKTEIDGIKLWGWNCCAHCLRCGEFIWADIIIENGRIKELSNLRTYEEYKKERI